MRSKPKCKSKSKSNSNSKSKSKSKSNSNSKSLALSVFVENVVSEEEAVPLSSYDPELVAAEKCSQPKTQQQQQPKCLRRSPRLSPLPDLPPETEVKSILGNVASRKFENKCTTSIRRSPRFTSPVAEAENSKTGTASLQVHASLPYSFYLFMQFLFFRDGAFFYFSFKKENKLHLPFPF
ncbi:unnamed protein product [Prunus armeniaca]|uniref:Uncharacterized protein n=1 Tax=Prunus armeniaca TaxID=36596 RepID=A0A6J5XF33_PRUAR|nr:unnamed protein product [Prunus armeniaca]